MDTVNTVLGIVASVLSIISVVLSVNNAKTINKIKGKINAGDGSTNTIGTGNRVTK